MHWCSGCSVSTPVGSTGSTVKWDGISLLSNIKDGREGMTAWRAYGIGPGKLVPWNKVSVPQTEDVHLLVTDDNSPGQKQSFSSVKSRRGPQTSGKQLQDTKAPEKEADESSSDTAGTDKLFSCPEEGCIMSHLRLSSLQHHLDCGTHRRELEHETLQDKAMMSYALKLEEGTAKSPEFQAEGYTNTSPVEAETELEMGWALKSSNVRRSRFSSKQKDYLMKLFKIGEVTRRKANPMDVSKAMRSARDESGNRLFTNTEFLTPKQVASFFSRVAASKSMEATDKTESEELAVEEERLIHSIRNQVEKEVVLCHPITYDVHNICELVAQGKLSVFSVKMLQDVCPPWRGHFRPMCETQEALH